MTNIKQLQDIKEKKTRGTFHEFTCEKCGYSVAEYVPLYQGSKLAGNQCPKCGTSHSLIFEGSV